MLTIASIPLKIAWADRDENILAVESKLRQLRPETDIVVLPEMFSTGYVEDLSLISTLSESTSGATMKHIAEWASQYGVAICGSFLCRIGENLYNRAFFVDPSGEEVCYNKHHLFSLSSEHRIFHRGENEPPIFRFRGANISMIVCYDLRFPVWCRNHGKKYDLMLVPANWPQSRAYAWRQLLIARAIENQAVYVGANRGGADDFGDYDDLTYTFDALGQQISEADPDSGIVYASVDLGKLAELRRRYPFSADADPFTLLVK